MTSAVAFHLRSRACDRNRRSVSFKARRSFALIEQLIAIFVLRVEERELPPVRAL